jgi:signal transduction histidine kinase
MATTGLDEHRLRLLLDVGRALVSEFDREALLRRVLDVARELTGARYAALGVLTTDGLDELERFITSGVDEKTHREIGDLPRGRGILGELSLDDISAHPRSYGFPPGHPEMQTFLGAPIVIRGEAWGNIYLAEKDGGPFEERDEESIVVLAEWAAVAIENARLYEALDNRREELERAVGELEATTIIARALGGETDLDRVLELVVKRARALVDARALLILLADGDDLVVAATAGQSEVAAVGARVPSADSAAGDVLRSGHAERLADVGSRVRLGLGSLATEAETAMLVPLTYRGRTVGVLVGLDRLSDGPEFDQEDERRMGSFATSAAIAVATAQTVGAEQLRVTIEAAEHERSRWARELHDETLQGLGALVVLLTGGLHSDDERAARNASQGAIAQIENEIDNLQGLITELRPAALDDLGLSDALGSLVERTRAVHGLDIAAEIQLKVDLPRLLPDVENTIYRLVQEALTNVAKHSRAEHVSITIVENEGLVKIEVGDDGQGFDPHQRSGGFGLVGMRERVDLLAGNVEVDSAPGRGTTVRAELKARHREAPDARSA